MARYAHAEEREAELNRHIEEEINELMQRYEAELMHLAEVKNNTFEAVQNYCQFNKAALFAKRRSIGTLFGIVGFRLGTPRLKVVKGSNWANVVQLLKEKLPRYIRTAEEPARDMLLADRNKEEVAPLLMEIGVQVVQDELFYIETKKAA